MNCSKCDSDKIKVSETYSDMWFCRSCGAGDYFSNIKSKKEQTVLIFMDRELANFSFSEIGFDLVTYKESFEKIILSENTIFPINYLEDFDFSRLNSEKIDSVIIDVRVHPYIKEMIARGINKEIKYKRVDKSFFTN